MAVREEIYQPQLGPGTTPGLPQASPEAFGAGVGQALEQVGDTLHRNDIRAYRIERQQRADAEQADFASRFARTRAAMDQASIDARNSAAPGAAGHAAAMKASWEKARQDLLDGITEDSVRRQADAQLNEFGARFEASEYEYEAGARVGKFVTDRQSASDIGANRARRMHDPKAYAEELSLGLQEIEGMQGVSADVKEKLKKYHEQTVTVGYLNGLNDSNPRGAIALIDAGAFDSILTPEQLTQARNGAEVQVRREQAEIDTQARLAKAAAKEEVDDFLQAGRDGVPHTPEEVRRISGLVAQYDIKGAEYDVAKITAESEVQTVTRGMLPQQISAELSTIEARIAKAGDKATREDIWRRDALRERLGQRRTQLSEDPYSFAATNGMAVSPLDLDDPQSIRARLSVNRALANATGRPVPILTKDEAVTLAAQVQGGAKAREGVATQLSRLGGRNAAAAARQVAPDDHVMERAINLSPMIRGQIFQGEEYLKGNASFFQKPEAEGAFTPLTGSALKALPGGFAAGTFDTARNLYGYLSAKAGDTEFDARRWDLAVHLSLGGDTRDGKQRGGLGEWKGASFLLPVAMSQDEFDRILTGINRPLNARWADGSAISAEQLRTLFHPVAVGDGLYRFEDGNGRVAMARNGSPAVLDIRREGR